MRPGKDVPLTTRKREKQLHIRIYHRQQERETTPDEDIPLPIRMRDRNDSRSGYTINYKREK